MCAMGGQALLFAIYLALDHQLRGSFLYAYRLPAVCITNNGHAQVHSPDVFLLTQAATAARATADAPAWPHWRAIMK